MTYEVVETRYGFNWGPVIVERSISDPLGGVLLTIKTIAGRSVDIRVSPKGHILQVSGQDSNGNA